MWCGCGDVVCCMNVCCRDVLCGWDMLRGVDVLCSKHRACPIQPLCLAKG